MKILDWLRKAFGSTSGPLPVETALTSDLTDAEIYNLVHHRLWPRCNHKVTGYIKGPSGGFMQNIGCPTCGLGINITSPDAWSSRFTVGGNVQSPPIFGHVIDTVFPTYKS